MQECFKITKNKNLDLPLFSGLHNSPGISALLVPQISVYLLCL